MPRLSGPRSCNTCKRRKIKCDEALPNCARCHKAGYMCDRTPRLRVKFGRPRNNTTNNDDSRELLKDPDVANLFHVYIKDLAPWYDLSETKGIFSEEIPKRALNDRLIFFAMIALSACYCAKRAGTSFDIAGVFHEKCLALLIGLSPHDREVRDGTALVATCLLRSYEILSETEDPNRHLFGASALLPPAVPNLQESSLFSSGFWNYLREDITYSLVYRCPLKISIGRTLDGVVTADNVANVMTLLLAKSINLYFDDNNNQLQLEQLRAEASTYWQTFEPQPFAHFQTETDDFPTIKFISDTQVAAHHYYRVLQCLTSTRDRSDLTIEICGLAMSALSSAVTVNAYGPISFTGQWVETVSQRNTLVKWLLSSEKLTGWTVAPIVQSLGLAWQKE